MLNNIFDQLYPLGAKVNDTDENGKTTLHWAAKNRYGFIVKTLIDHGAKVEADDNKGRTALHLAAEQDDETVVKILAKNHVNACDHNNCTPLFYAAEAGHKNIIDILISNNAYVKHKNNNDETALHKAAAAGHLEVSKTLLTRMKYADDIIDKEKILNLAAKHKQTDVVKYLLEVEAQIDYFNYQLFNHIYFAAKRNYKTVIKLLLEETIVDNLTLHYTAGKEDIEAVKVLFENGAKFNSITDEKNRNPLHWAALEGRESDIIYLIRLDKDLVKAIDNNNEPAIYESVWNGHIEITKILLEQDLDLINSKNKYGCTLLHIAAISCQVESFNFLKNRMGLQSEFINDFFDELDNIQLDDYSRFKDSYSTTRGLVNKLKNLEKQSNKLNNIDFIPFYQFFLKQLEKYAENPENPHSKEDKKIFGYLYTYTLSKISNLKFESKSNLIIDINEYFKMIQSGVTISVVGGPVGIAGNIIKKGASMAGAYVSKDDNSTSKFEIPSEVRDSVNQMKIIIKSKEIIGEEIEKNELKNAEQQIKILSLKYDNYPNLNIKEHLDKIQKALGNINSTKITKIVNEIKDEIGKAQEKLNLTTGIESDVIKEFTIAIQDTAVAVDLYDRYQNDKKELDAVSKSIKQAEDDINLLNQHEKNIYKTIIPMIEGMQEDISNIEKKIDKKSHVHLDLTKWQVQTSLKDIKYTIQQISKGFSAQEISRYMEKLDEGMTTLINVYDRIQEYYDQINLANYIAHINSPMTIEIEDKDLKNDIHELEKKIKSSIVKGYLKRARSAFKQWAFPFANEYSNVLNSQLDEEDTESIIQQIENLHLKVQERNVYVIKEIDNLKYSDFNSEYISTQPFFVWENNNYSQEISEFLVGKEITVKADITKTDYHKCAVKFNEIGIRLKSKDNRIQDEINNELKNFDVYMIHLGDSYYRYNEKFYVIRSNEQSIEYSFEKNKEGKPVRNNRAYERIRNDELMLSPYTTWKIKLKRETKYGDSKKADFDKLKTYEKKIDLELVGRGIYIDEEGSNDLMVGTYYKEYEHKPETRDNTIL
ncbi:4530_t:CDS:2 [Dentiscutata erythropus]|uniref:4530_t:CDS:1 n=1 Tax=Dentiscutata erythropus TaxID=1348616 RepID=A0A9N9A3F9_9GLOM|nr:4530_t:CDS:2 [Dentiscutata erythropus]